MLVLAEIMRNLGRAAGLSRRKEKDEDTENDESVLPVALETGDFCRTSKKCFKLPTTSTL